MSSIIQRAGHLVGCGPRVYAPNQEIGDGTMVVTAYAAKILGCPVSVVTPALLRSSRQDEFSRVGVSTVVYSEHKLRSGLPVTDAFDELLVVELHQSSERLMAALDAHIPLYKACWIIERRLGRQLSNYFKLKHGLYETHI